MSAEQLKKVAKICQKDKDIVFGFIKQVQVSFSIITDLIKHICLLYYHDRIFDSEILTDTEYDTFIDLLKRNNKHFIIDCEWRLLYKASLDGLSRDAFIEKVHDKPNIMCFIHSANNNVCGGYTSVGWSSSIPMGNNFTRDTDAFIFGIRSSKWWGPKISNVRTLREDESFVALGYHSKSVYCTFGESCGALNIDDRNNYVYCGGCLTYEPFRTRFYLLGGSSREFVTDVEVYQLKS